MGIELNKQLADASRVIAAAVKLQKKLAAVGVSAAEVAAAKKMLQAVTAERKLHASAANAAHAETHDKQAVIAEGAALIERARGAVHLVLQFDAPKDANDLAEHGGVGAHFDKSAARVEDLAARLVEVAKDARWKKALQKRGFDAKLQKRLADIAHALDGAAPFSLADDPALTADTRELFTRISYLRQTALRAFGAHSSEYAQFRASTHKKKKPVAAAPAA